MPITRSAVYYASPALAQQSYHTIQGSIFPHEDVTLLIYYLLLARVPHAVVIGEVPVDGVNDRLIDMLADGEPIHQPPTPIRHLAAQRGEQAGPWSERHHGPVGESLLGAGPSPSCIHKTLPTAPLRRAALYASLSDEWRRGSAQ